MALKFQCSCGKRYSVKDQLAGKRAKCKACGVTVQIPTIDSDEPLTDFDSIWKEEAQPRPSTPQSQQPHARPSASRSSPRPNLLGMFDVINLAKTLKGPRDILTKTLAASIVVPLIFALMGAFRSLFTGDTGGILSILTLVASSILAAIAAFVLSMFDYVKQEQQQGKTVHPIIRILFRRSLFHIVGWGVLIGVGIVILLTLLFEP